MTKYVLRLTMVLSLFCFASLANAQSSTTREVNGKTYRVHKVVAGETLYKISKKYNAPVKEIQSLNHISETVKIGQELLIPGVLETANSERTTVVKGNTAKTHKVVKGETLSKIAKQYNTTVDAIKTENNLHAESIGIGQVLRIPALTDSNTEATEVVASNDSAPVVVVADEKQEEKPVEKPVKTAVKEETKSQEIKRPAGPRQGDQEQAKKTTRSENGGMPGTAEIVLAETATEREETAMAVVGDYKLDQTRTFVVHPSLPKGSIIVVINEATGKMAYCRVVDNIKFTDLNGANLGITKAVADKIGLKDKQGNVKIKYAAP